MIILKYRYGVCPVRSLFTPLFRYHAVVLTYSSNSKFKKKENFFFLCGENSRVTFPSMKSYKCFFYVLFSVMTCMGWFLEDLERAIWFAECAREKMFMTWKYKIKNVCATIVELGKSNRIFFLLFLFAWIIQDVNVE